MLHRDRWLIPFLLYLAITLWFIFGYVPIRIITKYTSLASQLSLRPIFTFWNVTIVRYIEIIPESFRVPLGAIFVLVVVLVGTFASPTSKDNSYANRAVSLAGLLLFYAILYVTSANRKKIVWRTAIVGLLCQYVLALFVLRTTIGYDIFNFISFLARYLMTISH